MLAKFYLNNTRLTTDLGMILFSLAGCYLASLYGAGSFNESIALGTGYVSLILLAVTLLIGPINLLRKRKNPVNLNFRRDIGIWSGITAIVHVVFSLQITPGKSIIEYFTGNSVSGFGLFEIGNNVGLVATLIIVALLITSNQISLKLLKGKRWKLLQRFNYLLILLAVVHTVALQSANLRESFFFLGTLILSVAVVLVQAFGIAVTLQRSNERKAAHNPPVAAASVVSPVVAASGEITLARRRFLAVTGATLLGGVVVSGTTGYLLGRAQAGASANTTQAQVMPNTPVPAPAQGQNGGQANPANGVNGSQPAPANGSNNGNFPGGAAPGSVPSNGFDRRGGGGFGPGNPGTTGENTGAGAETGANSSNNPAPATAPAGSAGQPGGSNTGTTGGAASGATGSSSGGRTVVLGNLSALAVGAALKFTTPDTNETAFVIHEQDGSVKAFSGTCTHRPYALVYDPSQQELVCNLHSVPFNLITGAPTRSPARTALKSYKVQVDAQNNVVYDIS